MFQKEKYEGLEEWIMDSKRIRYQESMKKHTTVKVGGLADVMVFPISVEEIQQTLNFAKERNIPYYIIGCGSNLLVADEPLHAIVIKLTNQFGKVYQKENMLIAEAGAAMPYVAMFAKKHSLTGFEFASGIPGTVGGGVRMNAGAYGASIEDIFCQATYLDEEGNIKTIQKEEMMFGYRESFFSKHTNLVILSAKFVLKPGKVEEIEEKMSRYRQARTLKQPLSEPNFGSVFKRPEGYFVGKLIEEAGLKGYQVGGAMVSTKHAGFIVNTGNATCQDVVTLVQLIQEKIEERYHIKLETEVVFIGGNL